MMDLNRKPPTRHNFTKTFITNLPANPKSAKAREMELSDQQVVGLRIMVSKNHRKFWRFRYRFNMRKKIVTIGEFPAVSVQEARQRANEFKNMLSRGLDPMAERNKQSSAITFKQFVENEYLPHAKENKRSWRDDVSKFERHIYKVFADMPLASITFRDLQKYQTKIKGKLSASTSNRHMTLLIRIFNLAIQWQFLEKSPCKGIKKYKEVGKERYLSDEELKRFLAALNTAEQSVSVHVIRFLLFTGLRKSEATTLEWKNVDLDAGVVKLPLTKSGKSRAVVLNSLAKETLEKMVPLKKSKWVFPNRQDPENYLVSPRGVFLKILKDAKIKGFRLHDLRHTFASLCVSAGQSLYEVQKLLGHHSSQMTQKYAHLGDREMKAASESVANQIGRIAG